jgi:hypothetical protein
MGGSVQLVVRNKEGAITALPVWTNSMASLLLKNPKFLAGDFSYLTEFVNYHRELMADYDANHITRTFKDSNAGLFGSKPFGGLAPIEYGIVVIDFKTMKILDMQDYTNVSSIYMSLKRTVGQQDLQLVSLSSTGKDVQDIEEFISKGYCKSVKTSYESDINYDISELRTLHDVLNLLDDKLHNVEIPMSFKSQDIGAVLAMLGKSKQEVGLPEDFEFPETESFQLDLVIDQQGFEVLTYKPRNRENISKVKEEIITLGFPLTDGDLDRWAFFEKSRAE